MSCSPSVAPLTGKIKFLFAAVALGSVAALGFIALPPSATSAVAGRDGVAAPSRAVFDQSRATPDRIEAERITISPNGFAPSEIIRPAGRVLVAVDDRTGLDHLVLRLDAGANRPLREVRVPADTRGRHEWRRVIDLPPGSYTLTEADHPDWVCRITITGN